MLVPFSSTREIKNSSLFLARETAKEVNSGGMLIFLRIFTHLVTCQSTAYLSLLVIFRNNCPRGDITAATLTNLCLLLYVLRHIFVLEDKHKGAIRQALNVGD